MDNLKQNVKEVSSEVDIKEYMVESVEDSDFTLGQLLSSMNYTEESNEQSTTTSNNTSTAMVISSSNNTPISTSSSNQPIIMSSEATKLEKSYNSSSSLDDDFEIARKNIINITAKGSDIINDLIVLAKTSDHPGAFRVLNETITALSSLNKDLIDLYDKKLTIETKLKKIEGESSVTSPRVQNNSQTNNNIFVGTTDDLFDELKKQGLLGSDPQEDIIDDK
ncbi:MAG: hypothetical protein E6R13_01060 [Spirochaetes bacterium]|nr:MAG: hypothetical protein E6R13_01060 [Spirochaetota bacterium]